MEMIIDYDVADEDSNNNENQVGEEGLTPTQSLLLNKTRISNVANSKDAKKEAAKHELEVYQKLPSCHKDDVILLWWKQNVSSLPRLPILAKQILAIPATTSCSERMFSTGGLFQKGKTASRISRNTNTVENK